MSSSSGAGTSPPPSCRRSSPPAPASAWSRRSSRPKSSGRASRSSGAAFVADRSRRGLAGRRGRDARGQPRGGGGGRAAAGVRQRRRRPGQRERVPERHGSPRRRDDRRVDERRCAGADRAGARGARCAPAGRPRSMDGGGAQAADDLAPRRGADGRAQAAAAAGAERAVRAGRRLQYGIRESSRTRARRAYEGASCCEPRVPGCVDRNRALSAMCRSSAPGPATRRC